MKMQAFTMLSISGEVDDDIDKRESNANSRDHLHCERRIPPVIQCLPT